MVLGPFITVKIRFGSHFIRHGIPVEIVWNIRPKQIQWSQDSKLLSELHLREPISSKVISKKLVVDELHPEHVSKKYCDRYTLARQDTRQTELTDGFILGVIPFWQSHICFYAIYLLNLAWMVHIEYFPMKRSVEVIYLKVLLHGERLQKESSR